MTKSVRIPITEDDGEEEGEEMEVHQPQASNVNLISILNKKRNLFFFVCRLHHEKFQSWKLKKRKQKKCLNNNNQ